ncbi:hypothetical protein F7725_027146 [Dissostichus mawsoni]|uniref:Zinc transporter n=1 Tax=Dissostichus mawsoni TaxID=36200 RepID=A0A7J5XE60_DISMA|nr:hypothetical protein F7725_027146 [Dissostichus mawsoni]
MVERGPGPDGERSWSWWREVLVLMERVLVLVERGPGPDGARFWSWWREVLVLMERGSGPDGEREVLVLVEEVLVLMERGSGPDGEEVLVLMERGSGPDGERSILSDKTSRNLFFFLCLNLSFAFVELSYGIWSNRSGSFSHLQVEIQRQLLLRALEPPNVNHDRLLPVSIAGLLVNLVGIFVFQHGGHGHSHGGEDHGHSHSLFNGSANQGHSHGGKDHGGKDHGGKDHGGNDGHGHSHGGNDGHGHSHGGHGHSHDSHDDAHCHDQLTPGKGASKQILQGVLLHIIADTLGSVGVIISALLMQRYDLMIADPICSMLISLLIGVQQLQGVYNLQDPHFWTLCTDIYIGTLKLLVAPDADTRWILSQTHNIFTQAGVRSCTFRLRRPPCRSPASSEHLGPITFQSAAGDL